MHGLPPSGLGRPLAQKPDTGRSQLAKRFRAVTLGLPSGSMSLFYKA